MDDETLVAGRVYWALHGHRWVKAKVRRIVHKLDIHTLAEEDATQLEPNAIGHIELALQEPLATAALRAVARAGRAGAGRHRQPQDLGRRAGELTQMKPRQSARP
jgi:sulfate adenylyltransferase subunit 1 (EFTu-like GTPase family)